MLHSDPNLEEFFPCGDCNSPCLDYELDDDWGVCDKCFNKRDKRTAEQKKFDKEWGDRC